MEQRCWKERIHEWRDAGKHGRRKGGRQDWRDIGKDFSRQKVCGTGEMLVIIRETGKVECRTGWMQERRGAGKGGMKERRYAGKEIFKRGGVQI